MAGETDFMGKDIYVALRQGDMALLNVAIGNVQSRDLTLFRTPQKNTALHIAATFGRVEMAIVLINISPSLVCLANSKGDTPLHTAARAGDINLTDLLAKAVGDLERGLSGKVWRMRNSEGNTAMHEALKKRHEAVALLLLHLGQEQRLGLGVNDSGESPLYIAAEAGLTKFVQKLVEGGTNYSVQGPDGQTPLHIAVIRGHLEIVILLAESGTIDAEKRDDLGKTVLHYAATLGLTAISNKILEKWPSLAYVLDNDGNTPLHIASIRGTNNQMVKDILDSCPCAPELVDGEGRNALHLAVISGNVDMLRFMLKCPELKALINEPDNHGDTPLHLSVKKVKSQITSALLFAGADVRATNKENLTPRDVCDNLKEISLPQFCQSLALYRRGAPHGRRVLVEKIPPLDPTEYIDRDYRSLANTTPVIATLVATVSFAAAFTLPGGLINDGPDKGVPVFQSTVAFKAFVVSDAVAFISSIWVACLTLVTWIEKPRHQPAHVSLGLFIINFLALPATGIAFVTALYMVLSKREQSLAITVLCIGGGLLLFFQFCRFRIATPGFTPKFRG